MASYMPGGVHSSKTEAERPFWISYADLMTAMMVLFLAAMAVTIAAITGAIEGPEVQRAKEVSQICAELKAALETNSTVQVDCIDHRISFGEAGRFAYNDHHLPSEANSALAGMVPIILEKADGELGQRWMKQIVVEGYADPTGGYLYNLDLSMRRSQWVMCLLMDPSKNQDLRLTESELGRVRELFLAGGVSFNNPKESAEASRRVELRLQFFGLAEERQNREAMQIQFASDRCQLQ